ncbi:MAG: c-type cytochrome, partial [Planctomycetaceae bacterium]|nr:c-type cytochrome [Planctomycetaceae bacterium]
ITLLLQDGFYESFGKPHDGLGFVPNVMEHLHGSTAIAGIALGQLTAFPSDYRDHTFGGNVMTSRINSNRLVHHGSSIRAEEVPDFLSCDDPWFRPVDMVVGPDGALYVADFYNRIIGHYEVDLHHPGRDRHRGRIWRISYTGETSEQRTKPTEAASGVEFTETDLTTKSTAELVNLLGSVPEVQARQIADQLSDGAATTASTLIPQLQALLTDRSPATRRRALWLLHRFGAVTPAMITAACHDQDSIVRIHAFRLLNAMVQGTPTPLADATIRQQSAPVIRDGLRDVDPLVRRTAALAAARYPEASLISALYESYHEADAADVHLQHAVRMALREHLRQDDWFRETVAHLADENLTLTAGICLGLKTSASGEFLAGQIAELSERQPAVVTEYLTFAALYASADTAGSVVNVIRQRFAGDAEQQLQLTLAMRNGFASRNQPVPDSARQLAFELSLQYLKMKDAADVAALEVHPLLTWTYAPHVTASNPDSAYTVTNARRCADGQNGVSLFSSFEKGERRTGVYRSQAFAAPRTFSFYFAGHDGIPSEPLKKQNFVRLVDSANGDVLREASPPRNDVAQLVKWDLADLNGRSVAVELIDGDTASAYAWIAVGRFSVPALNPSDAVALRARAARLIGEFRLAELKPALEVLLTAADLGQDEVVRLANAVYQLQPSGPAAALRLAPLVQGASQQVRTQAIQALLKPESANRGEVLGAVCQTATTVEQQLLAEELLSDAEGLDVLFTLIESGKVAAQLLKRPAIAQRIAASPSETATQRMAVLVAGLPDENEAIIRLIEVTRESCQQQPGNAVAGAELFKKNCSGCHQIAGQGKKVGPNLDGIGNRGLDRVTEDVLAPNRNVDIAFRSSTVVTRDGLVLAGLLRELENDRISVVNSKGEETIVNAADVDERVGSALSPMPANFGEVLTADQLRDLFAYLVSQRQ